MIGYGKVTHLFVSLFGDPSGRTNQLIRANVDRIAALRPQGVPALKLDYFDATSANVWG
jgi:hypothetical protein